MAGHRRHHLRHRRRGDHRHAHEGRAPMSPRMEANLMADAFKRIGVVRIPPRWGLPPEIVHVAPDGRQGTFVLNAAKPPLVKRSGDLTEEVLSFDYRQVTEGPARLDEKQRWKLGLQETAR